MNERGADGLKDLNNKKHVLTYWSLSHIHFGFV